MVKRYINIRFKEKGDQPATYLPVQEGLIALFRAGWFFLEINDLYKNLTLIIKVLRFISSPFFSFLNLQKTNV
jgi:hypothetical protein